MFSFRMKTWALRAVSIPLISLWTKIVSGNNVISNYYYRMSLIMKIFNFKWNVVNQVLNHHASNQFSY